MRLLTFGCPLVVLFGLIFRSAHGQEGGVPAANPANETAAATVNGQPIPEKAVQRGLKRLPPAKQAEARADIVNYLIDNVLLDQYLLQLRIDVPQNELDSRMGQVREEIKKSGQTIEKVSQELMLTEEEMRGQLLSELRWEKYVTLQATDKVLREFFDRNQEMFDGTMVRARHVLCVPTAKNEEATKQAVAQLQRLKQELEESIARKSAELPPESQGLAREKAQNRLVEESFAELARKESACPSKEQGGDLGWFPRAGSMVEPFAKAAFELKPYQLSDVIATQFGYHLILVTDRRPGKETKFDDVKDVVKEVYGDRLREYLCGQLKPRAKIVIIPAPK